MMPVRFSTSRNSKPPASLVMDPPSNCPRISRCFRGRNGNGSWLHSVVIRLSPLVGVTYTLNTFYATKRQPLLFSNEKCGRPNVSQGGRGAAKSSSIRQRSELNIRKSSYGPSPADLLAVLSPNVSIFCQGKTEHSPNRPAYPNSSGYSLPFSSAELRLATAGAPGGTAPGKDSPSTATPRPCVR